MTIEITEVSVYRDTDWEESVTNTVTTYAREDVQSVDSNGEPKEGAIIQEDRTSIEFVIYKDQSYEKGLVSGWANVAKNADGSIPLDWQGDIIEPSELEDAAIEFMLKYRDSGECHTGGSIGTVVESVVLTKDKQAAMGIPEGVVPEGWFITVKIFDDDVIAKVKNGDYRMFSIQGTAEREAVN